jgi:23S rRNA (uracil747-C5)-methyltransferase
MPATFCAYYDSSQCHSCEWIEQNYATQLSHKEKQLCEALSFFPYLSLEKTTESPQLGFRNRAKMSVTGTLENPIVGLLGENHLDQGRELLDCPIHHPALNQLFTQLPDFIRKARLTPYRISERTGELKGLIAFYSPGSDQMYLRFILRSKEGVSRISKYLPELQANCPLLACISVNLQPVPHAILEGPEEIILTNQKMIEHRIDSLPLKLSPQSFVQTNAQVAESLYKTAASWLAESRSKKVLELFCGQGTFSFVAEKNAGQFLGIEINPEAVKLATAMAKDLGLVHLKFQCADATQPQKEIENFSPDLILVNPPRRGLAQGVRLIQNARPQNLIYSSCHIESLTMDLKQMADCYQIKKVKLFDMFPHTRHFETLIWLQKKSL